MVRALNSTVYISTRHEHRHFERLVPNELASQLERTRIDPSNSLFAFLLLACILLSIILCSWDLCHILHILHHHHYYHHRIATQCSPFFVRFRYIYIRLVFISLVFFRYLFRFVRLKYIRDVAFSFCTLHSIISGACTAPDGEPYATAVAAHSQKLKFTIVLFCLTFAVSHIFFRSVSDSGFFCKRVPHNGRSLYCQPLPIFSQYIDLALLQMCLPHSDSAA